MDALYLLAPIEYYSQQECRQCGEYPCGCGAFDDAPDEGVNL